MDALILPLLVFVALIALTGMLSTVQSPRSVQDTPEHGYRKKGPLFTPVERTFYAPFASHQAEHLSVFYRARIADLLEPYPSRHWQKAFNALNSLN